MRARCLHKTKPLLLTLTLIPLLFLVIPAESTAMEVEATEWELGLRWIGNWEDELADSSGNVVVTAFSFRLPLRTSEDASFVFVPGVTFYTLRFRYDEEAERTVLSDIEWRELTTFVPLLDASLRWNLHSTEDMKLAVEGGLGLELPVPVKAWDTEKVSKILTGYYGKAKPVLPSLSFLSYWPLTNAFDVSTRLSAHLPVHHLWDGESAPLYDHLGIMLSVGIRLPKGERSIEDEPAPPRPEGAPPLPE